MTHQPPDPAEAIAAHTGARHRAERMLAEATSAEERAQAQFWIDNADRNISKWRAVAERGQR